MNLHKFLTRVALLLTTSILTVGVTIAQDKNDRKENEKALVRSLIESKNFTFVAQSATPMGGRFINLTSLYDVRVAGDTVLSDLPYFGRAYVAPMNATESALQFRSMDFNYNINERKKGGWDISISPKDGKDVRQMQMTVSDNGTAYLQVMSNNRQPISFNGYIMQKAKS